MNPYRTAVSTPSAPAPLPHFSQAVKHNGLIYCSGTIGNDPATGQVVQGTVQDRTRRALRNLSAVLEAGGSGFHRVLKCNIFLTDMENFKAMNEVWDEFFTGDPKPCRTCVAVHQLPLGTDVEIEMTASYDG